MRPTLQIFCDFDGTITPKDTIDYLLETLADPAWQEIEARWVSGEIGSRECLSQQIPLIQGGWQAIEEALSSVQIDPFFAEFADWCHRRTIPLFVVSEGLKPVIQLLLKRERIVVDGIWANDLKEGPNKELSMAFPSPPSDPNCRAGLCKCNVLGDGSKWVHRVVVGDGLSDLCWAANADMLFAKSKLLAYCRQNDIACQPFDHFKTVQMGLEAWIETVIPFEPVLTRHRSEEKIYARSFKPIFGT
jgi:2-hydroxy-3-keto-5-methylthiopentenyl-1-phosphate phosphatase